MELFRHLFTPTRAGARRVLGTHEREELLTAGVLLTRLATQAEVTDGDLEAATAWAHHALSVALQATEAIEPGI